MRNKGKKLSFAGLMAIPAITSIACAYTTSCAPKDKDDDSVVHILDFNDLHGAAVGYGDPDYPLTVSNKNPGIERIAKTYSDFLVRHPNTVFLSGGDNNSSDCFSSVFHGETIYPILKAMNVRYSSVGNHAFEWGLGYMSGIDEKGEEQETFEDWAQPEDEQGHYFLTSNIMNDPKYTPAYPWVYHEGEEGFVDSYNEWDTQRVQWADPATVIEIAGHPIGVIGLTTQETKKDGNQSVVTKLGFTDYIASIHFSKYWLKRNSRPGLYDKIEAFILLTHVESGQDEQTHAISGACATIAENIDTKISAIISAHSHKEVCGWIQNKYFGNAVWIGQANTAGRAILDTRFKFSQPDPITGKCSIEEVSMNIIHPEIQNSSIENARKEILSIRKQALKKKDDDLLKNVVNEFALQNTKVIEKFDNPINNAMTSGEIYPAAADRTALGHKYLWPSELIEGEQKHYVLEQMGGWINYAQLEGFRIKTKEEGEELKPALCFTSFDSITSEFAETQGGIKRPIKYGDIYQAQTYENTLYFGYLTIGQLANIVEYLLAGRNKFNYENNPDYISLSSLNNDFVSGKSMLDGGLEPISTCKYLCGPMQFWGMSFKTNQPESKIDRDRSLTFERQKDGTKIPQIKICSFADNNDLRHPEDWKDASVLLKREPKDQLIPILISSFVWTGGNKQNTMFKNYMEYNERTFGKVAEVREYTWKTFDVIFEFLESVEPGTDTDLDKELVHNISSW